MVYYCFEVKNKVYENIFMKIYLEIASFARFLPTRHNMAASGRPERQAPPEIVSNSLRNIYNGSLIYYQTYIVVLCGVKVF